MRNQIVILAAGKGTRMGGNVPKVLVMLKDKPLILYLLGEIEKINQLAKPVIVVGYKAREVMDVLGDDFVYALQKEQLGTAHALLSAKGKITGQNILVINGDHPLTKAESLKQLMQLHHVKKANISMFTTSVPNFRGMHAPLEHFGRVIRDSRKKIVKIVEFKDVSAGQKKIKELSPGIYMFNTAWLWKHAVKIKNKNEQAEYYLTDIVEVAIEHGEQINSLPINPQEVIGVNKKEDLRLAQSLLS